MFVHLRWQRKCRAAKDVRIRWNFSFLLFESKSLQSYSTSSTHPDPFTNFGAHKNLGDTVGFRKGQSWISPELSEVEVAGEIHLHFGNWTDTDHKHRYANWERRSDELVEPNGTDQWKTMAKPKFLHTFNRLATVVGPYSLVVATRKEAIQNSTYLKS